MHTSKAARGTKQPVHALRQAATWQSWNFCGNTIVHGATMRAHWPPLHPSGSSASVAPSCLLPRAACFVKGVKGFFLLLQCKRPLHRAKECAPPQRGMSRTGLRLATAVMPALAAMRPAHEHARAEHARHARCTRARLASDPHAPTLQHALARQKQGWRARVTGHWLTVGRSAACASGSCIRCKCDRHLRCSCGACVAHTLCMPCATTVVTCAER